MVGTVVVLEPEGLSFLTLPYRLNSEFRFGGKVIIEGGPVHVTGLPGKTKVRTGMRDRNDNVLT